MSFEEFIEIESALDVGENDLVPVSIQDDEVCVALWLDDTFFDQLKIFERIFQFVLSPNNPDSILTLDLKRKLTPILTLVNQMMKKWKKPAENTVILSEICLRSCNKKDPLRFKLPNDQCPYGTKFYGITDTGTVCSENRFYPELDGHQSRTDTGLVHLQQTKKTYIYMV